MSDGYISAEEYRRIMMSDVERYRREEAREEAWRDGWLNNAEEVEDDDA